VARRAILAGLALAFGVGLLLILLWDPLPHTQQSFDRGRNGLWLGHQWYTGRSVRDGSPVSEASLGALVTTLTVRGVRYAYVHVGPVRTDGSIDDVVDPIFASLRRAAPDVVFMAWLGARVENVALGDPAFQSSLNATITALFEEGFSGVHFDFEPIRDGDPGYLALLAAVRKHVGPGRTISQATPRAGPFGLSFGPLQRSFWSRGYYRETMRWADQTVVMAYDTGFGFTKGYVEFVRHQTTLLIDWGCAVEGQEVLIGVPSYEDVPLYSNPQIENLRTASLGVRSALERYSELPACFSGVSVYANWVTDPAEWADYDRYWMAPAELR
jgi:hypothetical protein